jgi:hypothetical protein
LWQGDTSGYASASEADLALCGMLAFWCGRDIGQMDRLFRKSGLMRDKWNRPQSGSTYGMITIEKAIANALRRYINQVVSIHQLQKILENVPLLTLSLKVTIATLGRILGQAGCLLIIINLLPAMFLKGKCGFATRMVFGFLMSVISK